SFRNASANSALRWGQRFIGATWIRAATDRLIHVEGWERLPPPEPGQGIIWASNHRSFFDMFVANAHLFGRGYHERVLYPVRSEFFYDSPLGFVVNGIMSFWSMYPPIFRDRKRASLNHTAFAELARAAQAGRSVGIHPEGTRNLDSDPYQLLPGQSGVGRLMHLARTPVVPFFINGLGNNPFHQIRSNFDGTGKSIIIVFGAPVEMTDLLRDPPTGKTFRALADRVMQRIAELGEEEREIRAKLEGDSS
ncbi:MAG: lysophospholipid acyltransferase family protein, partial [Myxococcota bacterium]